MSPVPNNSNTPRLLDLKARANASLVAHLSALKDGDEELQRATLERFLDASNKMKAALQAVTTAAIAARGEL